MITTIIAAHMGSKRLPGKTLMEIAGKTCLEHVVEAAKGLNPVVATYADSINQPIWTLCEDRGIPCYVHQGDGYDVLARFLGALEWHRPTDSWCLRITTDCPMLTYEMVMHFWYRMDFKKNTIYTNRPMDNDGFDMEIFPVDALRRAHEHATDVLEREHCTQWMYRHLNVKRSSIFSYAVGHPEPEEKLSVDTIEEYNRVKELMEGGHEFSFGETRITDLRTGT